MVTERTVANGGIFADAVKIAAWTRDGERCQWVGCGIMLVPSVNYHFDHIYPWSKGFREGVSGALLGSLDNCILLCNEHNQLKGDKVIPGALENLGLPVVAQPMRTLVPVDALERLEAARERYRQAQQNREAQGLSATERWVDWHQKWHRQMLEHSRRLLDWLKDHPDREPQVIEMMRKAAREWAGAATLQAAQNPKLVEYAATCGKAITL